MKKVIKNWKLSVFPDKTGYLIISKEIIQTSPNTFESPFANEMIKIGEFDKDPGLYDIEITLKYD